MKIVNWILPLKINHLVFVLEQADIPGLSSINLPFEEKHTSIKKTYDNKKQRMKHELLLKNVIVYKSNTYNRVHVMKCINHYNSPVIGDCFTKQDFRGKSIYPYMLQIAANDILKKFDKVFVLVSSDNIPSIRGIEKAGFKFKCRISAIRIGIFYINKQITTKL
jgi:hypothetical protein